MECEKKSDRRTWEKLVAGHDQDHGVTGRVGNIP